MLSLKIVFKNHNNPGTVKYNFTSTSKAKTLLQFCVFYNLQNQPTEVFSSRSTKLKVSSYSSACTIHYVPHPGSTEAFLWLWNFFVLFYCNLLSPDLSYVNFYYDYILTNGGRASCSKEISFTTIIQQIEGNILF